ncbi:hypothetical protein [Roseococcus sp. YIM B11640]|uniref:hypothetical protein n=1 Tax=Roseococcus sp. YIM B11640 TaxID=3133973 RepID=UPI003C7E1F3A
MKAGLAVLLGGLLLIWPAFVNRYPIIFSDTGAFLDQTVTPLMIWDKPWIYGPFAWIFHQHLTLWGVVVAQGLIVSHLLWLLARTLGLASPGRHLAICLALAALTAAPWSAALVMPDIMTPAAVVSAGLLGWGWDRLGRWERGWLLILGCVATASHLSNLPVIFALTVLAGLLRTGWASVARVAAPLLGAVALLLATNLVGHGRLSISPYGSTFFLARLIADGPAARTIAAECPASGWYLCAFADRLPTNSDDFLWRPDSPVNRGLDGQAIFLGGVILAPEARAIIATTLRREPLSVLADMARNFLGQLRRSQVGDTLSRHDVGEGVRGVLARGFPASEVARFDNSLQMQDRLKPIGRALNPLYSAVLILATPLALLGWWRAHRERDARRLGLLLCLLVGLAGNALATGALSMPHHRYQARIVWLLPLAAILFAPRYRRGESPVTPVANSSCASAVR